MENRERFSRWFLAWGAHPREICQSDPLSNLWQSFSFKSHFFVQSFFFAKFVKAVPCKTYQKFPSWKKLETHLVTCILPLTAFDFALLAPRNKTICNGPAASSLIRIKVKKLISFSRKMQLPFTTHCCWIQHLSFLGEYNTTHINLMILTTTLRRTLKAISCGKMD